MDKQFLEKEEIKKELEDFKAFAIKKSMIGLAIGMILATALTKFVNAISECLFMPIINSLIAQTGTNWREFHITLFGIVFEFGKFLGSGVDFLITAFVLYIIYTKILLKFVDPSELPDELQSTTTTTTTTTLPPSEVSTLPDTIPDIIITTRKRKKP